MKFSIYIHRFLNRLFGLRRIYTHIVSKIPRKNNLHILDIGSGRGELLRLIHKDRRGKVNLLGIDADRDKVVSATKMLRDRARVKYAFASKLPALPEEFDVVVFCLSLHHIDLVQSALSEMWRVLKPGGIVIMAEFIPPRNLVGTCIGFFNPCRYLAHGIEDQIGQFMVEKGGEVLGKEVLFGHIVIFTYQKPSN
jgi:ubiquinone/menaquinone biosynthesis C-methylase UbiE